MFKLFYNVSPLEPAYQIRCIWRNEPIKTQGSKMQLMIFKARENERLSSRFSYYVMSGLLIIGVKTVVSFYTWPIIGPNDFLCLL